MEGCLVSSQCALPGQALNTLGLLSRPALPIVPPPPPSAIVVLESNLGYTQLHDLLLRAGSRRCDRVPARPACLSPRLQFSHTLTRHCVCAVQRHLPRGGAARAQGHGV